FVPVRRERQLELAGVPGHGGGVFLFLCTDRQERNAALGVGLCQVGQRLGVARRDRALERQEHHHDGLPVPHVVQRHRRAGGVGEGDVVDFLVDLGVGRGRVGGGGPGEKKADEDGQE